MRRLIVTLRGHLSVRLLIITLGRHLSLRGHLPLRRHLSLLYVCIGVKRLTCHVRHTCAKCTAHADTHTKTHACAHKAAHAVGFVACRRIQNAKFLLFQIIACSACLTKLLPLVCFHKVFCSTKVDGLECFRLRLRNRIRHILLSLSCVSLILFIVIAARLKIPKGEILNSQPFSF